MLLTHNSKQVLIVALYVYLSKVLPEIAIAMVTDGSQKAAQGSSIKKNTQ